MADDRHIPGLALPRTMLRVVAVVCLGLTWLALFVSMLSIVAVVRESPFGAPSPYGMQIFIVFMTIALSIQFCLLFVGYQLGHRRTSIRHHLLARRSASSQSFLAPA